MTTRFLLRLRSNPNAAVCKILVSRRFASGTRSNENLTAEFKRDLKKEVALLALMVVAGVTGIHFYQHRENAPVNQVDRLIKQAKLSASQRDHKQALDLCRRAYQVIQDTNAHDRHLFELAFSIAAQYESLDSGTLALRYYLDALEHNLHELNAAKRDRNRVVTLDRIAQLYENRGYTTTAEKYFKEAISVYDQNRGPRELSKASDSNVADLQALDQEIPGVLYNYSHLLMTLKRWNEAENGLKRALTLARISSLSDDYIKFIKDASANVRAGKRDEAEAEQK